LLLEHKSKGKSLDKAFSQAISYVQQIEKEEDIPKRILVSDFENFRLYDMDDGSEHAFKLSELSDNLHLFDFIIGREKREYKDEDPVNIQVAATMGQLHDLLKKHGYAGHDLELLLVRIMFCMFADDTGIFNIKDHFHYVIENYTREDGSDLGYVLEEIFSILNTIEPERQTTFSEDFNTFPYINGKLFSERLKLVHFDRETRSMLLSCASYDWGKVSPAVFGSMFQAVMDNEERRNLGAHYTSEKNILKVIDSLFLKALYVKFEKKKNSPKDLKSLLKEIISIRIFDPACGCGNFLIIAYRELRKLEIHIHRAIIKSSGPYLDYDINEVADGINVDNMYGMEIEEFPAQIARVALWIVDHMMNISLSKELGTYFVRLPLIVSPNIERCNALQTNWQQFVPNQNIAYIISNPPFKGGKLREKEQTKDLNDTYSGRNIPNQGNMDYVTCWYLKAIDYIQNTNIGIGFVSTNSICQGEQVAPLWDYLMSRGAIINFAHRTFMWNNEAANAAKVFVVIIGFDVRGQQSKELFEYPKINADPVSVAASHINKYLVDFKEVSISRRSEPICAVPPFIIGSKPLDGGFLCLSPKDKEELVQIEPNCKEYIRPLIGATEYLYNEKRYCLWLHGVSPSRLLSMKEVMKRVEAVREDRKKGGQSKRSCVDTPHLFGDNRQPESDYLVIPKVSSEGRRYIPLAFYKSNVIVTDLVSVIPNANLFHFGVLSSEMHMAWVRQIAGRLKGDFRYTNLVYNNFPWPREPSEEIVARISEASKEVLRIRSRYFKNKENLATLYDPKVMPKDLIAAHKKLNGEVDRAYRSKKFRTDLNRLEFLLDEYDRYVSA